MSRLSLVWLRKKEVVFGLWKEATIPAENPRMHRDNVHTAHRNALAIVLLNLIFFVLRASQQMSVYMNVTRYHIRLILPVFRVCLTYFYFTSFFA